MKHPVNMFLVLGAALAAAAPAAVAHQPMVLIGNERGGVLVLIELPEAMWEG